MKFLKPIAFLVPCLSAALVLTGIACSNTPECVLYDADVDAGDASDAQVDGDADANVETIALPSPLSRIQFRHGGGMPMNCSEDSGVLPGTDLTTLTLLLD